MATQASWTSVILPIGEVAIRTQGLRKRYGELEAVRGIDLCVPAGEIFGLLGRNGAGKARRSRCRAMPPAFSPWRCGASSSSE